MSFWREVLSQFLGDLGAGLVIVPLALWAETTLDEWRDRRHERKRKR